jgi:hypothetical protein
METVRPDRNAQSMTAVLATDLYSPRAAWFARLVDCGPTRIKLYFISMDGDAPTAAAVQDAIRIIADCGEELEATPHRHAGFAILHRDDEVDWLTLQWWTEAGTLTHKLWRAEPATADFVEVDKLVTTCVWELGIVDFERRAWMETVMSRGSVEDYLARTFPRGTV